MPPTASLNGASPPGRSSCSSSLALLLFGAVIAFKSWQLGAGWLDDGPGAGYFPFYIGVLVCVASLVTSVRALMASGRDDSVFVSNAQLKLVFTVLLPSLAFVLAAQFLGLYVGSFLFIAGFMVWVGHYAWATQRRHRVCGGGDRVSDVRGLVQGAPVQGLARPAAFPRVLT